MKIITIFLLFSLPILAGSTNFQKSIPAKVDSQQASLAVQGVNSVDMKIARNDSKSVTALQKISVPERVQMIVNIIAIISAIYAFMKLFMKNRKHDEQLLELKKQNEIFQRQLEMLQKYFETDLSIKKSKIDKENKERMRTIRPFFKSTSGSNKKVSPSNVELSIINIGQTANKINISFPKCTNIEFDDLNKEMDRAVNNFNFALKGKIKEREFDYIIRIEFDDDDGNKYYQILNGRRIFIKEAEPVLISEKENTL